MLKLAAYLDRIGYAGATDPSAETLRGLHRAHMLAVPFENLDIHLGRKIVCDEERFLHKIVDERRGGFCYEMNGAFAALLRELGFHVTLLSAGVTREDGTDGPEFDHLTLLVDAPADGKSERWLADVGFGDSFIEPLRFEAGVDQPQIGRIYRLVDRRGSFHLEANSGEGWKGQYTFTLQPRQISDYAAMCHHHQTSPETSFTRQRICSLATSGGRITLSDWKMIETRDGKREEHQLSGDDEWRAALKERFRIELPA